MNIYRSINELNGESWRAYGEHSAFAKCYTDLNAAREADRVETSVLLESAPEPSDTERSEWPPATFNYVTMLEDIIDDIMANQLGTGT